MERNVDSQMEAEGTGRHPAPNTVRKVLMKANSGKRTTLARDRHKMWEQKLILTADKASRSLNQFDAALTQIQKSMIKANRSNRNRCRQEFQQRKEYKLISMMNKKQMHAFRFELVVFP
jgi:hypothetical protein